MTYKLTAIISGGQTGADRAGLQAAIDLGIGWGGWAPAGWRAEDGEIPAVYRERMKCTTSSDYGMRTRLNVQDSDGTLIISFAEQLTGGSKFTVETCERQDKAHLHLVLPDRGRGVVPDEVRTGVLEWIDKARVSVLNVAGPRESKEAGLQQAAREVLVWIFEERVLSIEEQAAHIAAVGEQPDGLDVKVRSFAKVEASPFYGAIDVAHEPTEAEWAFANSCTSLALSVPGSSVDRRVELVTEIHELCNRFYEFEGNGAGGSLHVVLDDYNTERDTVAYCMKYASDRGDIAGAQLALLLLALTDDEIDLAVRGEPKQQCGDCGAEIIGFHGACEGMPGWFGDEP